MHILVHERRFNELIEKGQQVTFDEVLENVQERDYIDTHREDSPLVKADDAIEINNSTLSLKMSNLTWFCNGEEKR